MSKQQIIEIIQIVVPSFSFLIALGALLISIRSYRLVQKHQILTVKPLIRFREKFTLREKDGCGIMIRNAGLGPALIKKFTVNWEQLILNGMTDFSLIPRSEFIREFEGAWFSQNSIIEKESNKWIFRIPLNQFISSDSIGNKLQIDGVLIELRKKIHIEVEYSSLYENEIFKVKYP